MYIAQLLPLPLTVSCVSKIQTGFTFLVPAHPGSPGQGAVKRVCVCVSARITATDTSTAASFSVSMQEIGLEERLQNDLFCVWWDVKP